MRLSNFITIPLAVAAFLTDGGCVADAADAPSIPIAPFLAGHGYRRIEMFGSYPSIKVTIDGHPATLVVDTGSPYTALDRSAAAKLGIKVIESNRTLNSPLGPSSEHFGFGMSHRIAIGGNIVLAKDAVVVLNLSGMNHQPGARRDGTFGLSHMQRLGAVISCGEDALYVNPDGSKAGVSESLTSRGFVRVPMRINHARNPEVDCQINGLPSRIVVETAAFTTIINERVAREAGIQLSDTSSYSEGVGHRTARLSLAPAREFAVGIFKSREQSCLYERRIRRSRNRLLEEAQSGHRFRVDEPLPASIRLCNSSYG